MKTVTTPIHRALQDGKTIFISLEELDEAEMDGHYARVMNLPFAITAETVEIPLIDSEIHMWESMNTDKLYPHLHFVCPLCERTHCTDLEDGDPNPRFACCDSCSWDSLVWLNWDEAKAAQLATDQRTNRIT